MSLELIQMAGEKLADNQKPDGLPEMRAYLIQRQPAFASLLFGVGKLIFLEGRVIDTAGTDGEHIFIAQPFWNSLKNPERVFLVAHEILHLISRHPQRMQVLKDSGFDGQMLHVPTYNNAADYWINDVLIQSHVGDMPAVGLHDPSIGGASDTVDAIYRKLMQQARSSASKQGGASGSQPGAVPPGSALDRLLAPSAGAPTQAQLDQQVAKALATAKAQGSASGGLQRLFERTLTHEVDWRFLLRNAFHASRGRTRSTWSRLNRRYLPQGVMLPGRNGTALGTVVVAFDTSGSIGANELAAFLGECRSILEETRPKDLWAVSCDMHVYTPTKLSTPAELEEYGKYGIKGGGGTDFAPVFDWVEKTSIKPEVLVFFTDGYGCFPRHQPRYPTIWVSTSTANYPFGRVIKLNNI